MGPRVSKFAEVGPCLNLRLASREFMRALLDTGPTRTFCTPFDSLFVFSVRTQTMGNFSVGFIEEFGPTMVKQYQ